MSIVRWSVKMPGVRLDARSIMVAALMIVVVIAVMFGIDLINGRWDEPTIQPQL